MSLDNDFEDASVRRHETREGGRDWETHRCYYLCPAPRDLPGRKRWKGLKAIGVVTTCTRRNGIDHHENRYYIVSRYLSSQRFAEAVRGHWGVENNLHWQLDVTFGEDACRIRNNHGDTNFSLLRRTALSLLKNETSQKIGIKNKRLIAGWDEDYLMKVLFGQ